MTRLLRSLFIVVVLAVTLGGVASAQVPTGTPPFGSFGGGPDAVNLANLNSHLVIPVVHKAGRGTNFTYDLSYDTSVWYPVGTSGSQSWTFVNNFGWRAITEVATGYLSYNVLGPGQCADRYGNRVTARLQYTGFVYHDPFGVPHRVAGTISILPPPCSPAVTGGSLNRPTVVDGSGYVIDVTVVNTDTVRATITSRSGSVVTPPLNIGTGGSTAVDRNGNEISVNSSGVFTDTLGTTALTVSGVAPNPTTFSYMPPSGGNASYTMSYKTYAVKTNFGCSSVADYGPISNSLVDRITLPDGTFYQFQYEPTPGFAGDVTGRLASVTLPTGGTISYTYTGGSSGHITCADGSTAGLTRSLSAPYGTWTYTRIMGTSAASTTTITDPSSPSNQTVIQFQGIYETQRQVYQGQAPAPYGTGGGTLLQTLNTCYNGTTSPASTASCTSTAITQPITQRAVTTFLPGTANLEAQHIDDYSSVGVPTETDDYDYGHGAIGSLLRKTSISYASLGNITAFRQTTTVQDGAGHTLSQLTNNYDEPNTLTATSGISQHTSVTGSRGNLTSINYPVSGLTEHLTYYDTGSPNVHTDINGAQTTYNYSSNAADCQMAFPTSFSEPLSLSRSFTWNCTGGVLTQATDENSHSTTATYTDADFWRPFSATDPANATTKFTYNGATSTELSLAVNGGNSAVDVLQTVDIFGNSNLRQIRQAPGSSSFDSVETDYDSVGRPSRATLPYVGSTGQTSSSAPATTTSYDALNRPLTVQDAGGGSTAYSYSQNDLLVTIGPAASGENTKRRQLEYDALGRLTSVCEITGASGSGACGQNNAQTGFWTKYTYNTAPSSTSMTVTQNAQAAAGSQQTRTYTYDAMGRLISEVNPENGTTTYTYDTNSTCGTTSSGDLVRSLDNAGNATCYSYDTLHRVLSKTYTGPNASGMPNKYFVYDSATVNGVAMANTKTRLAEAYTATSATGAKTTDLGFSYSARGEISDQYQSSPSSAGYYHENLLYWENGATKQISGLPYLPTFTYTLDPEGRVSSIAASVGQNPLTGTTYNAASLPTSVSLGSGDSDAFTYDPNTDRMTKYQYNINGQPFTGALTWNANGTLAALNITDPFNAANTQNCVYSHDDLARIASVNCGASTWQQNFGYDAFGNLTKTVPTGGTGNSFQPTYSLTTNRISSLPGFTPSYDPDGNVLNDGLNTYARDAEGRPTGINGTAMTVDALGRVIDDGFQTARFFSPDGSFKVDFKGQLARRASFALPGGGVGIFDVCGGGLIEYDHADHLGSPRLGSNPNRGFLQSRAYAPFGELYARSNTNAAGAFTGQSPETSFDQYNFPFREYSTQGRWASPDPAGLAAVDPTFPQSWNRYAYVLNNPLAFDDPTGLVCDGANQSWWGSGTLANGTGIFTQDDCTASGGSWAGGSGSTGGDGGLGSGFLNGAGGGPDPGMGQPGDPTPGCNPVVDSNGHQTGLNCPPTGSGGPGAIAGGGNGSPSPTWAAIKTFFTLPNTGPGSCLAVFKDASAEPLLSVYHATEGALEVGSALVATSVGAGSLASGLSTMKNANPMFGGQLDPFLGPKVIAGARVVASVTGRFGLATEHLAAAYVPPIAAGLFVGSLAWGLGNEIYAVATGKCHN